eukprot:scaffold2765_cov165-Amphora_coffeaeformis.AAC.12
MGSLSAALFLCQQGSFAIDTRFVVLLILFFASVIDCRTISSSPTPLPSVLALVGSISSSFDIKSTVGGHFKIGPRRIRDPLFCAINFDRQQSAHHGHALGGFRAKMVHAGRYDANAKLATIACRCQTLDLFVEIGIVLDRHGREIAWYTPDRSHLTECQNGMPDVTVNNASKHRPVSQENRDVNHKINVSKYTQTSGPPKVNYWTPFHLRREIRKSVKSKRKSKQTTQKNTSRRSRHNIILDDNGPFTIAKALLQNNDSAQSVLVWHQTEDRPDGPTNPVQRINVPATNTEPTHLLRQQINFMVQTYRESVESLVPQQTTSWSRHCTSFERDERTDTERKTQWQQQQKPPDLTVFHQKILARSKPHDANNKAEQEEEMLGSRRRYCLVLGLFDSKKTVLMLLRHPPMIKTVGASCVTS